MIEEFFNGYASSNKRVLISFKKKYNISIDAFLITDKINLKKNEKVNFQSLLKLDYINILEFNDKVRYYFEDPFKIVFGKKSYIPDFYIEYWNDKKEIIIIKNHHDLIENAKKYNERFKVLDEFCKVNNLSFKILSEKDINTDYLFNIKFLQTVKIRHAKVEHEYFNEFELLAKYMTILQNTTPNELLDHCTSCELKRAELIQYLWFMILYKKIKTNLKSKLNMYSKIWI